MKFKTYGMVLSLFFALGLVFSFGIEASADHGSAGIAAGDVDPTVKAEVEAFLDHIIDYYDQVVAENAGDAAALNRGVTIYGRDIRREGSYKNSATNMYSMGINERGIITNHARYPNLFGYVLDSGASGSAVASTIQALIDDSGVGMTACQEDYDGQGRVACATKVESPTGDVTVIAGLHHAEDDSAFSLPDCAEFTLATNAEAVFDDPSDANLEAYVKGIIGVSQQLIADITASVLSDFLDGGGSLFDLADPAKQVEITLEVNARLYDKAACFGSENFKHGNIYAFIMDSNLATSTVLFNGNNFDLNGASLELDDDSLPGDDKSIAGLFSRALEGETSAYANYRWDDPTTTEDDVPNFFRDRKVPGTSCKRSYIEVADINGRAAETVAQIDAVVQLGLTATALGAFFPEQPYIFGSGTYPGEGLCGEIPEEMMPEEMMPEEMMPEEMMPEEMMPEEMTPEEMMGDGDDGCAIAGAGYTSQSTLLNLFLIVSILFSVVFLRRHA